MDFLGKDNLHRLSHQMRSYLGGLTLNRITVDGQAYSYLDSGETNHKETILFIHGFSGNKTQWRSLMDIFSKSHRVIAFDMPGLCTGVTTPSDKYDFSTLANEIAKFVNVLDLKSFHLFGHSMGASISTAYAGRHSDKLLSLTLASVVAVDNTASEDGLGLTPFGEFRKLMMFNTLEDFTALGDRLFYSLPSAPGFIMKFSMNELIKHRRSHIRLLTELDESSDLVQRALPFIGCPCLVIGGDDDFFLTEKSLALLEKRLNNVTTVMLDQCGHVPHLEKPRDLGAHYASFLESITEN